ncbi:LysR family transcriptional regulator [Rhodococcus sp. NCIMB 12038]|uniref:LysR family transcriptional regulator n=1 Tax=Rhodococcus sp. NCIMB 12038 TaxID=933800 RepID=UPI0015C61466|nr:LysR family transcriptional regulator [Rhodococcus sp. NCIMB 12038]
MLDVELLKVFLAVAEEESIHAGARKLMVAQPSVSRSLRRLERELGEQVLVRSHKGVRLTPAGEELLAHVQDIVGRMERVPELVKRAARPTQPVTVGLIAGAVAASKLTEAIFHAYAERVQSVDVIIRELNFGNQFRSLEQGEVDVALIRPPYRGDQLCVEPLFGEPVILCCRSDNPIARFESVDVDDILDLPMVEMLGVPDFWSDFWLLKQQRDGCPQTFSRPVTTMAELRFTLLTTGGVMPISRGAAHYIASDPMTGIELRGAPLSVAAVATRRDEVRPEVHEFVKCARDVTRKFMDRIEGGVLLT